MTGPASVSALIHAATMVKAGVYFMLRFVPKFIAILRITSRFPFEISEAETEEVAGPYTEYSGLMFGLSMGLAYIKLYMYSLIVSLVFLGGWLPTQDCF